MAKTVHSCSDCNEDFTSEKKLREHKRSAHANVAVGRRPRNEFPAPAEEYAARKTYLVQKKRAR